MTPRAVVAGELVSKTGRGLDAVKIAMSSLRQDLSTSLLWPSRNALRFVWTSLPMAAATPIRTASAVSISERKVPMWTSRSDWPSSTPTERLPNPPPPPFSASPASQPRVDASS